MTTIMAIIILALVLSVVLNFCLVDKLEKSGRAYEALFAENEKLREENRELKWFSDCQRQQINVLKDAEAAGNRRANDV